MASSAVGSATPTTTVSQTLPADRGAGPSADGSALDWPGLSAPTRPATHQTSTPAPTSPDPPPAHASAPGHRRHADPGLVSGSHVVPTHPRDRVVVRRGDSLWSIAALDLGDGASDASISAAWHAWYDANRERHRRRYRLDLPGSAAERPAPASLSTAASRTTP